MTDFEYTEENRDGVMRDLTASLSSRIWLGILVVSVFGLIAAMVVVSNDTARSIAPESAPPISVFEAESDYPNQVNTSQLPDSSFIYDISIDELANADPYLDGQTVQVTGEVVGDKVMAEDDPSYCWITLQSMGKSDSELDVYMPTAQAASIDTFGAYGRRGTELQVRGTFNLACADHQGISELHSENVAVVEKGKQEELSVDPAGVIPGILLIIFGSVSMLIYNVLRERQR